MTGSAIQLLMCSVTTPDLPATVADWNEASGYRTLASDAVPGELADLWGVAPNAHGQTVISAVPGTDRGYLRWIDTQYAPTRDIQVCSRGPFALEFFSNDVDAIHARFTRSAFRPLSPPVTYNLEAIGSGVCRSFAARGPGDIWVFLTTMCSVPAPRELPTTPYPVAPVINMPIAGAEREPLLDLYRDLLGIGIRFDGDVADPDVNAIMGAPPDWNFHITVFFLGDGQLCEQHIHPAERLPPDPTPAGVLRSGPVIETLLVSDLADVVARARASGRIVRGPIALDLQPYGGRLVACIDGVNGEILELVQV